VVQAVQVRRGVYVAQVGSVVRSHLHCWGWSPGDGGGEGDRRPTDWGEAGLALRPVMVGGTGR